MALKKIIESVLTRLEFDKNPPVLIDIGASGVLHEVWQHIAPHAIGIAFDADNRDFQLSENNAKGFKKLYTFNRIVTDKKSDTPLDFYLTHNAHCSSTLKPLADNLTDYHFAPYFAIDKVEKVTAITLQEVLETSQLTQIDWLKSDTQGTDLRLFKSLPKAIQEQVLAVELEPGIIDAYADEDKLTDVLDFMSKSGYTILNFKVKGPVNLTAQNFEAIFSSNFEKKMAKNFLTQVPGWVELSFINTLDSQRFTVREWLLAWVFTTAQGHHAAAFSIAEKAMRQFKDAQLPTLLAYSKKAMRREIYSLSALWKAVKLFFGNL
jgi:FkbM family methyltransferase